MEIIEAYKHILTISASALLGIVLLINIMLSYLNSDGVHSMSDSLYLQSKFFDNYLLSIVLLVATIGVSIFGLVFEGGKQYLAFSLVIFFTFLVQLVHFTVVIAMISSSGHFSQKSIKEFIKSISNNLKMFQGKDKKN